MSRPPRPARIRRLAGGEDLWRLLPEIVPNLVFDGAVIADLCSAQLFTAVFGDRPAIFQPRA